MAAGQFEQVRRKQGIGVSPRDTGIVIESDVTPDGARYRVAWDAEGRDVAHATWHLASEIEWMNPGDKGWTG